MKIVGAGRGRWFAAGLVSALLLGGSTAGASLSSGERSVFVPLTPCRAMDTRPGSTVGPRNTPLGSGETHHVSTNDGNCYGKVPPEASGVSLNVTTVDATQQTYITVWASGAVQPEASNLNPSPGQPPTPNAVISAVSDDGHFDIFNSTGTVQVLVDINGYYIDHNHDDRYLEQDEPITESVSPAQVRPTIGSIFSSMVWTATATVVSADGSLSIPFDGPVSIGGTSYELASMEYCVVLKYGGYVTSVGILTDDLVDNGGGAMVPLGIGTVDQTDRTASGCYSILVSPSGAGSYGAAISLAGSLTADSVWLYRIRTTWNPVS